jgi:hypothetical protein
MAKPQQAPFPQELIIGPNWEIVFDAIDPASGASVAGVTVSGANVTATNAQGVPIELPANPPPLLTNVSAGDEA